MASSGTMVWRVAAAVIVLVTSFRSQQLSTIRVPVPLVSVPTLVVSKAGKYVPGLSAKDFQLSDNGHLQNLNVDVSDSPISVVMVIQANDDVREYLPFIRKTGSLLDNSIAGARGQAAVVTYNDEVSIAKPFAQGELRDVINSVSPSGSKAKMLDAGMRGIVLLKERLQISSRILLFIGQPYDDGSRAKIETLAKDAENANVQIYALTLPILGKAFVSDSFSLSGFGSQFYKGGYQASIELTKAVPALRRAARAEAHTDPFSFLTTVTGGIQLQFRRQNQLENAIIGLGDALRSRYFLSYRPNPFDAGVHRITVQVGVPDTIVYARPGYTVE